MDEPEGTRVPEHDRPARHKAKPAERVPVQLVRHSGQAALVEFADVGKAVRVTLPEDLLEATGQDARRTRRTWRRACPMGCHGRRRRPGE